MGPVLEGLHESGQDPEQEEEQLVDVGEVAGEVQPEVHDEVRQGETDRRIGEGDMYAVGVVLPHLEGVAEDRHEQSDEEEESDDPRLREGGQIRVMRGGNADHVLVEAHVPVEVALVGLRVGPVSDPDQRMVREHDERGVVGCQASVDGLHLVDPVREQLAVAVEQKRCQGGDEQDDQDQRNHHRHALLDVEAQHRQEGNREGNPDSPGQRVEHGPDPQDHGAHPHPAPALAVPEGTPDARRDEDEGVHHASQLLGIGKGAVDPPLGELVVPIIDDQEVPMGEPLSQGEQPENDDVDEKDVVHGAQEPLVVGIALGHEVQHVGDEQRIDEDADGGLLHEAECDGYGSHDDQEQDLPVQHIGDPFAALRPGIGELRQEGQAGEEPVEGHVGQGAELGAEPVGDDGPHEQENEDQPLGVDGFSQGGKQENGPHYEVGELEVHPASGEAHDGGEDRQGDEASGSRKAGVPLAKIIGGDIAHARPSERPGPMALIRFNVFL